MKAGRFGWVFVACGLAPWGLALAAEPVTRREAIATAEAYQNFVWTPSARNAFHGRDAAGVAVETPDRSFHPSDTRPGWWAPGQPNIGVPYMWGGFSSLEEFRRGIEAGRPAGDIYTREKRERLDGAVSQQAVGIDCSGLISRCWKLERSYSTRELPSLCVPLLSYDDLKAGDILNSDNNHVLMFAGWKDQKRLRLFAYEAGSPPTWKVLLDDIPLTLLQPRGYKPYRYRLMRD